MLLLVTNLTFCDSVSQRFNRFTEKIRLKWTSRSRMGHNYNKVLAIRPFLFEVPSRSTQTYAQKHTFCNIRKMSAFNIYRVEWKSALKQLGVVLILIGGVLRGVACTGRGSVHARALPAHSPSLRTRRPSKLHSAASLGLQPTATAASQLKTARFIPTRASAGHLKLLMH